MMMKINLERLLIEFQAARPQASKLEIRNVAAKSVALSCRWRREDERRLERRAVVADIGMQLHRFVRYDGAARRRH